MHALKLTSELKKGVGQNIGEQLEASEQSCRALLKGNGVAAHVRVWPTLWCECWALRWRQPREHGVVRRGAVCGGCLLERAPSSPGVGSCACHHGHGSTGTTGSFPAEPARAGLSLQLPRSCERRLFPSVGRQKVERTCLIQPCHDRLGLVLEKEDLAFPYTGVDAREPDISKGMVIESS